PQFAPARTLKERLAEGGEPDLADLLHPGGTSEEAATDGGRPEESFGNLFDLESLELPELEEPPPPAPAPDPAALAAELRRRLEARDFQGVLERAREESAAVAADPELARIAETAQARVEARPYVESFLEKAGAALRGGDPERAEQMLDRARSLDPEHPLLEDLEGTLRQARPAAAAPEPAAAPPPASAGGLGDEDILGGYELPDMDALPSLDEPWLEAPTLDEPEPAPAAAPPSAPEAQGDDRIAQLLAEGQRAADEGRFQEAIDSWSRIFLIDVDHAEAARRIEEARRSKAEREREVEEVFHEGLAALEGGDRETARRRFERVIEMQPSHLAARSYLNQIESGEPVDVRPAGPTGAETVALGELGSFDLADLAAPRGREAPPGELKEEILVPPPPGSEGAAREGAAASSALPSYGKAVAGREPGRRTFLLVGGLVLVLVLAAAAVLYVRKDSLFPNSDVEEPAAEAAPAEGIPGTIERATQLQERGQTAMALGLLRRLRPDDPRYDEAQELIARWETPPEPAAEEAGVPPEAMARRARLVRAAEAAFQGERYLLAEQLYDRAAQIAELEGDHQGRLERARAELAPLEPEIRLFREGEYELVLPRLWRLHEEDPSNLDVRTMLVDSYYNRGVRQLQRGDPAAAAGEFEEALGIDPEDPDLRRHYLFAQTYQRRPRDLLYRIYVKYLPLR
ncbi:MAG TPA: hypothetical protein VF150_02380, partial [Thermoanaerobaculia bacterium]